MSIVIKRHMDDYYTLSHISNTKSQVKRTLKSEMLSKNTIL